MSAGIYIITNQGNNIDKGKCYIGLSKDIDNRRKQHFHNFTTIKGKNNKKLYWAMDTFGFENFSFGVLEYCDVSELAKKEIFYIKKYDSFHNGYNSSEGGEGIQKVDLIDRFDLLSDLNLKLIDEQDYADPKVMIKQIDYLNQLITKNKQILETKLFALNSKIIKYEELQKNRKKAKINQKMNLLKTKFDKNNNLLFLEKKQKQDILDLIEIETKLKKDFYNLVNSYVKKSFDELKVEDFNSSIEKKFSIKGPAYSIYSFQKNKQQYQKIKHYSNFGSLSIYSDYFSFKPEKRLPIKILFKEIKEIVFIIYEQDIYLNFNGCGEEKWKQITKTYRTGFFNHPNGFYLVFSNNEFSKLTEVILSIRRELRI